MKSPVYFRFEEHLRDAVEMLGVISNGQALISPNISADYRSILAYLHKPILVNFEKHAVLSL